MSDLTDHSEVIARLRGDLSDVDHLNDEELARFLAADLLEAHDDTGLSLDHWIAAREFVERQAGVTITENGA